MGPGAASYVVASTIGTQLLKYLPPGSKFDYNITSGSVATAKTVADKGGFGCSYDSAAIWAQKGLVFFENKPQPIKGIATGFGPGLHFAIALAESGIKSFEDIVARKSSVRIFMMEKGTVSEIVFRKILEAYGLTPEDIVAAGGKVVYGGYPEMRTYMMDKLVDVALVSVQPGHPTVSEIASYRYLNFFVPSRAIVDAVSKKVYVDTWTMPAGSFPGMEQSLYGLTLDSCVFARADVDEKLVYLMTKAIVEQYREIQQAADFMKFLTPERAVQLARVMELHPGAERYYREVGLLK
jgi:TRAP transporter TAXI family solute receptor